MVRFFWFVCECPPILAKSAAAAAHFFFMYNKSGKVIENLMKTKNKKRATVIKEGLIINLFLHVTLKLMLR